MDNEKHDKIVNQQGLIYHSKGTLPAVGRRDHEEDMGSGSFRALNTLNGNSGDAESYYLLNLF